MSPEDVKKLLYFLKRKIPDIKRLGITGSYADGTQTPKSDLDIIVDIDSSLYDDFWRVAEDVRNFVAGRFRMDVDYILLSAVNKKLSSQSTDPLDVYEKNLYKEMLDKVVWEVIE